MTMGNRAIHNDSPLFLKRAAEKIADAFFPPRCIACGHAIAHQRAFLCAACFDAIELNSACYCPICLGRIGDPRHPCHRNADYLLAPATFYKDPVPAIIHCLKYQKLIGVSTLASALLIAHLNRAAVPPDQCLFVPIPLHPSRERERGFNQAFLLAQSCANYFNRPLADALTRIVKTKQQASLRDAMQRHTNVAGAFTLNPSVSVRGATIILVDDVSTSGATLGAAARALRAGGARRVIGAVIAKAQ